MFFTKISKPILVLFALSYLASCSTFIEKDNTPEPSALAKFTPSIEPKLLWSTQAGKGVGDVYLKNGPVIAGNLIYTSSSKGMISAINKQNGLLAWQINTPHSIVNGPGVGSDIVVVASPEGHISALNRFNGSKRWHTKIAGEALAAPAISKKKVIIKTIDGRVLALSALDGHVIWRFQQVEPSFILRAASKPIIKGKDVLLGFANGNLAKLTLSDGQLIWTKAIASPKGAFTIERMIDIDATPVIYNQQVYAASYQGKIAALDWYNGNILWSSAFSSYTGLTAANNRIFASDVKSNLWSFNHSNGKTYWKQTRLKWRNISGPVTQGEYVVVGDAQGFLHWIKAENGQFAARKYVGGEIFAAPIVENDVLYALTNHGRLLAYKQS